jgi:hypothetical protein
MLRKHNVNIKYFDQKVIVRNIDIDFNREQFLDLTLLEFLETSEIISSSQLENLRHNSEDEVTKFLDSKIKLHFQIDFLNSEYLKQWLRDPNKLCTDVKKFE